MDDPNQTTSSEVNQAGPPKVQSNSNVGPRHPEKKPAGVESQVDILQQSPIDRDECQRLADQGWHTLSAIPSGPSHPSGPTDRQPIEQPEMAAHLQATDAATVGLNSQDTVIQQSSDNQSNIVPPGLQTSTNANATMSGGGEVRQATTSAPVVALPVPKNVQSEESPRDTAAKWTGHNRRRGSRGGSSSMFSKRRGQGQGQGQGTRDHWDHRDTSFRDTTTRDTTNRDTGNSYYNSNANYSNNTNYYRTRLSHQPINFIRGQSSGTDQLLTVPSSTTDNNNNNRNQSRNHNRKNSSYNSTQSRPQPQVVKTNTISTGTAPPPQSTVGPKPLTHPSDIELTSKYPAADPTTTEDKQSHGDGDKDPRTVPETAHIAGLPTQEELAINALNRDQIGETPEAQVDKVDRDQNNSVMAYGRGYPSGPQSRGAPTAAPSTRDGNQPSPARRSPDQTRTVGTWGRGYVPPRGRASTTTIYHASFNLWVPPHLRKEALQESPAEGNAPSLLAFENGGPASQEPELTKSPSNHTGYTDAGNAPGKLGQQHAREAVSGALGGEGSHPVADAEKEKKAIDANIKNVQVIDKQGPGSSPNGPAWETKSATPTKILVHHGPKANQTTPREVHNQMPQMPKANNRSARWASKADVKPAKVSPRDRSEQVTGTSDESWPSNETVRSIDGLRNWEGGWAPAPVEWETRPGWKDRNMTEHLNTWIEKSVAGEALDVASHEFRSGVGTANGEMLVAPPEDEVTLPNPEKSEKAGQTSNTAMLMKRIRWLERRLQQKEKQLAQALANKGPVIYAPDIPENPHAPRANIYLRHGVIADLTACKDIYNHYAAVSVVVQDRDPIDDESIRIHYQDVRGQRLPWIVAVERGPESNGYESAGKDKIVGYAFADDYGGPKTSYRYTVEMQVFTHHKHLRMGVGKTLMDRLLIFLDPMYIPRGGYDFIDNDDFWGAGGQRVISKVLCNIPYTTEDNSEMKWLRKWLEGFEFDEMGILKEVGLKFDKWLNVLHMQKNTGSSISLVNVN